MLICVIFLLAVPAAAKIEDHITRTESGFYYTVQKGDTLWDLSRQFENSPWQWPQLWSSNPQIHNPHLIYPGQKILIFKKEWEGKEKQKEVRQAGAQSSVEQFVQAPEPEKVQTHGKYYTCLEIDGIGFIRKEAVSPAGAIFKSRNDKALISSEDYVYIRPAPGSSVMTVGDKYVIYHVIGPIKDKDSREVIGYQHLITGIVEITSTESEYVIGKVGKVYRDTRINDLLMPYEPHSPNIALKDGVKGLKGKLIKAESDKNLIGQGEIVFFDKGTDDGVEPGQSYTIYQQETAFIDPDVRKPSLLSPEYIGKLLVLHTEPTTATAYVTNSISNITPENIVGDLTQ